MKKYITILIVIISSIGLYFGYTKYNQNVVTSNLGAGSIVEVTSDTYNESIHVTGVAKLAHEQKLKFIQTGRIQSILVKPGQLVKKGELLAQMDMGEFEEVYKQASDRVELSHQKLELAQAKIAGFEGEKQKAELQSLLTKLNIARDDLQKIIKTAPEKTITKKLELEAKKAELSIKEANYSIDFALWEKDTFNKSSLIAKKITDSKKITDTILQNASNDFSELVSIRNGINKVFAFQYDGLTNEERNDAVYVGWNVPGLRGVTETSWRDSGQYTNDVKIFIESIEGKTRTIENAKNANTVLLIAEERIYETLEKAKKTLDNSQSYDTVLSVSEIESLKTTLNGYRSTLLSRITTRKENQNLIPLMSSDALITAQVDKELAEKQQALINQKITIEKLKTEIIELSSVRNTGTGYYTYDTSIQRDIMSKKQEILDLEVQISSKKIDIEKLSRGKTDEIISLETEYKTAASELKKTLAKKTQYELVAPIDGVIRSVKMLEGDNISSTATDSKDGSITIEDNNAVEVVVKLGQKDIVKVQQDTPVNITLDTFPEITFTGSMREISSSPDEGTTGGDAQYEVRILFDKGSYPIYSGMSANIEINLSSKENVIFVPITAIHNDSITGETTITVVTEKGNERRSILLGVTDTDRVEVLSGVTIGERVLSIDFNEANFKNEAPSGGFPMIP